MFSVPSYRRSCGVYLFDEIKIGGESDPLQQWRILVIRNGQTIRKVTLRELGSLSMDKAGYHLLMVNHP